MKTKTDVFKLLYKNRKFYILQTWEKGILTRSILIGRRRYNAMLKDKYSSVNGEILLTLNINHFNMAFITGKLIKYENYTLTPEEVTSCFTQYGKENKNNA